MRKTPVCIYVSDPLIIDKAREKHIKATGKSSGKGEIIEILCREYIERKEVK